MEKRFACPKVLTLSTPYYTDLFETIVYRWSSSFSTRERTSFSSVYVLLVSSLLLRFLFTPLSDVKVIEVLPYRLELRTFQLPFVTGVFIVYHD